MLAAEHARPRLSNTLTHRPLLQFVRYLATGASTVVVDSGLLYLFREGMGLPLWLATSLAFCTAVGMNFRLNMAWVYGARARLSQRIVRYSILAVANYALTLAVVLGLSSVGVYYLIAKWLAIGICVLLNFFAYRYWVFD